MPDYLRFEQCKVLPEYASLIDIVEDELTLHGWFSKEGVCQRAELSSFVENVRWDYIVRWIQEKWNTELIPMASVFFKNASRKDKARRREEVNKRREAENLPPLASTEVVLIAHQLSFPGRYIATGHGKKTAGYALASRENGHFLVHRLETRRGIARGCAMAAQRTDDLRLKLGVQLPKEIECAK